MLPACLMRAVKRRSTPPPSDLDWLILEHFLSIKCPECGTLVGYSGGTTKHIPTLHETVESATPATRPSKNLSDTKGLSASSELDVSDPGEPATGKRVVAALIDIALLVVLFIVMASYIEDSGSSVGSFTFTLSLFTISTPAGDSDISLSGVSILLYLFLIWVYYVIFERVAATSLGKAIVGLKVVKLGGETYGLGAAAVRNLVRFETRLKPMRNGRERRSRRR